LGNAMQSEIRAMVDTEVACHSIDVPHESVIGKRHGSCALYQACLDSL